jgi:hypothetical protein
VEARGAARAASQLAVLFTIGLLAGAWTFLAPWVLDFPASRAGVWTGSTWAAVWVGSIVVIASAVCLVTALGLAMSAALRPERPRPPDETGR